MRLGAIKSRRSGNRYFGFPARAISSRRTTFHPPVTSQVYLWQVRTRRSGSLRKIRAKTEWAGGERAIGGPRNPLCLRLFGRSPTAVISLVARAFPAAKASRGRRAYLLNEPGRPADNAGGNRFWKRVPRNAVWQLASSVIRLHLIPARPALHHRLPACPLPLHLLPFSPFSDLEMRTRQLILIATPQQEAHKQPVFIAHLCSWTRAVDLGDGAPRHG